MYMYRKTVNLPDQIFVPGANYFFGASFDEVPVLRECHGFTRIIDHFQNGLGIVISDEIQELRFQFGLVIGPKDGIISIKPGINKRICGFGACIDTSINIREFETLIVRRKWQQELRCERQEMFSTNFQQVWERGFVRLLGKQLVNL